MLRLRNFSSHDEEMLPSYVDILHQSRLLASRAGTAVGVFLAFWIASRILYALIERFIDRDTTNSDLIHLLAKTRVSRYRCSEQ